MQALTTWRLWQADATARVFDAVRRLLEEKGLAGREWELRYEYPARLLPDSEAAKKGVKVGDALVAVDMKAAQVCAAQSRSLCSRHVLLCHNDL